MRVPIRGGGDVSLFARLRQDAPRGAGLPEAASNCLRVKVTGKKSSQHRGAAAPVFLQCGLPAALPRPVPTLIEARERFARGRGRLFFFNLGKKRGVRLAASPARSELDVNQR